MIDALKSSRPMTKRWLGYCIKQLNRSVSFLLFILTTGEYNSSDNGARHFYYKIWFDMPGYRCFSPCLCTYLGGCYSAIAAAFIEELLEPGNGLRAREAMVVETQAIAHGLDGHVVLERGDNVVPLQQQKRKARKRPEPGHWGLLINTRTVSSDPT